jgi:HTH-type transcriptional regulator/antitoxin HigA
MMDVRPIRTDGDYDAALASIAELMDAEHRTEAGDRLDVLVALVEAYEQQHWRINPPDPIDAIKLRMQQRGLTRRDLQALLGARCRVAAILNRWRPLTLTMVRQLHIHLGIPAESLIKPTTRTPRHRKPDRNAA